MRAAFLATLALVGLAATPGPAAASVPLCDGKLQLQATSAGTRTDRGTVVMVQIRNASDRAQDVGIATNAMRPGFRLTVQSVRIGAGDQFWGGVGRQNLTFGGMPTLDELAALLRFTCTSR